MIINVLRYNFVLEYPIKKIKKKKQKIKKQNKTNKLRSRVYSH